MNYSDTLPTEPGIYFGRDRKRLVRAYLIVEGGRRAIFGVDYLEDPEALDLFPLAWGLADDGARAIFQGWDSVKAFRHPDERVSVVRARPADADGWICLPADDNAMSRLQGLDDGSDTDWVIRFGHATRRELIDLPEHDGW